MKPNFAFSILFLGVAGHTSLAIAQSAGTFTATGNMNTARAGHTATLLQNGKVLIAGGWQFVPDQPHVPSAELYDPDTGTFTPTGEMTTPRVSHSATLLPDGTVLIVGNDYFADSAEIYDPATGTFTPRLPINASLLCNAATLLPHGKVLITLGTYFPGAAADGVPNKLYDLTNGTFSATGVSVSLSHYLEVPCPSSILLPDGKVLITWDTPGAELYAPDAGTFSLTGDMLTENCYSYQYTATLLTNGRVLIAGGEGCGTGSGRNRIDALARAQLYDPPAGGFIATGNLTTARISHTATLLPDGTVLIAGGAGGVHYSTSAFDANRYFADAELFTNAELYAPDGGTFAKTGDMTAARRGHTATLLNNGRVLVAGGFSQRHPGPPYPYYVSTATAELYTPAVLVPAPMLLSLPGDGKGQGAIQHADTYQVVSSSNPATPGEMLVIYFSGLIDGSLIPPQVTIGGRMAEVLWFGNTPGFVGLNQVNVRVPAGVASGPTVPVRLTYLSRVSNEVTISVQ